MSSFITHNTPYENIMSYKPHNDAIDHRVNKYKFELKKLQTFNGASSTSKVMYVDLKHRLDDIFLIHYSPTGDFNNILFSIPAKIVKNIPNNQRSINMNTIKYEEKINNHVYYDKYNYDDVNSFRSYEFIDVKYFNWLYGGEFFYSWDELHTTKYNNIASMHNVAVLGLIEPPRIFMLKPNIPEYLQLKQINQPVTDYIRSTIKINSELILIEIN